MDSLVWWCCHHLTFITEDVGLYYGTKMPHAMDVCCHIL
jgi:hypothetical protein